MAVLVISFAATTLDTAVRIQRFILTELGNAVNIKALTNRYFATVVAILPAIALALWSVPDPVSGELKKAGWLLWPVFGASNQMLAGLTLMVITLYFWKRKRPVLPLKIPMLFVMSITLVSLVIKTGDFIDQGNNFLVGLNLVLLALIFWMMVEGLLLVRKLRGK